MSVIGTVIGHGNWSKLGRFWYCHEVLAYSVVETT